MTHDGSSLDWLDYVIRGTCGALFGAALGFGAGRFGWNSLHWVGILIPALVVAVLAIHYGDAFWRSIGDYLRFW